MDIQEIKKEYFNGDRYKQLKPTLKKYSENYIIDANITIKENIELVKKLNEDYLKEVERLRKENVDKLNLFKSDMVEYIIDEYHFTQAQAEAIEQKVYNDYHYSMQDYFDTIDEVCDWIREILNMN